MASINLKFDQGEVSSRNRSALAKGELEKSIGWHYKPGDPDGLHKIPGRTAFGTVSASKKILGVKLCQFDSGGTDRLVALTDQALFAATPGATGTFASIQGSRSTSATQLSAAHALDKWFLVTGFDRNTVMEADGTVRDMGMFGPQYKPVATPRAFAVTAHRPTVESSAGWTNPSNAVNSEDNDYAHASLSAAGSSVMVLGGWTNPAGTGRRLSLKYRMSGAAIDSDGGETFGIGGQFDSGYRASVKIEVSTDLGVTYLTHFNQTYEAFMLAPDQFQLSIADGVTIANVKVRVTLTYLTGTTLATLRVYDSTIIDDASASRANFTTTLGLQWAVSEWDEDRALESAPSDVSEVINFASQNLAQIPMPAAAENTNTTHWKIYRNAEGGAVPNQMGLVATIPVAETDWVDDFTGTDYNVQPSPLIPMVAVVFDQGKEYYPMHSPPPQMDHISTYKGQLIGVKGRALYSSIAGYPESWPEINAILNFPFPEHDNLVASVQVGESHFIGAEEVMLALDDIPHFINGVFNASEVRPLSGQPGLVAAKALTAYSVAGESRAAWVSRHGVHSTDTFTTVRLTADADWETKVARASLSTSVLEWHPDKYQLIFAYDTPSGDRRHALIHMAPEHRRSNGQPKITWDHYSDISDMTRGEVAGVFRVYSGHNSDGVVYLEDAGVKDESNAYDSSGNIRAEVVPGGRVYSNFDTWEAFTANLRHKDAGSGETVAVTWEQGNDSANAQTVTKTVSVAGEGGTDFFIGRAGDWARVTITHSGQASVSLLDLRINARKAGRTGKVLT